MEKSSPNNEIELFKPPVPKARPSIRDMNLTKQPGSYVFKNSENFKVRKNMNKSDQQYQEFTNISNNDIDYTDDDDDDDDDSDDDNNETDSFNSRTLNISRRSQSVSITHSSPIKAEKIQNQSANGFFTKNKLPLYCICILFFAVLSICVNFPQDKVDKKIIIETEKQDLRETRNMLDKSIQVIQSRFQNQKVTIWNDISAGIYDMVLFPTKPSIIILFGNETVTLNCLAQLLGEVSGNILGSNDYLMLTPKDFPNDVGQVIHNFKVQITQKKVVIVQDLFSINTEAIKAFHNFCDREKPLVEHAMYIITIIVDGYKSSQRELEFIEKQIFRRLTNYIDKDILNPLITRLTDGVIVPVLPESSTNFRYTDCSFSVYNKL